MATARLGLWFRLHTFVFSRLNVLQSSLEMFPWAFETRGVLGSVKVGVDEFDEAIKVLCCDGIVFLVEVVDVSVEDLDEQFDGYGGVHAGVCDSESTLEAFQNALTVTVDLRKRVSS